MGSLSGADVAPASSEALKPLIRIQLDQARGNPEPLPLSPLRRSRQTHQRQQHAQRERG